MRTGTAAVSSDARLKELAPEPEPEPVPKPKADSMQIFVDFVAFQGRIIVLSVERNETIGAVKLKIHDKNGIPPDRQRLTWRSKHLQDELTLADYNIQRETTLRLDVRAHSSETVSESTMPIFVKTLRHPVVPGTEPEPQPDAAASTDAFDIPEEVSSSTFVRTEMVVIQADSQARPRDTYLRRTANPEDHQFVDSNIVGTGDEVQVLHQQGSYSWVEFGHQRGYIASAYLSDGYSSHPLP